MKTILYINGKLGIWMRFEGDTCIRIHVESVCVGQADYQPCAWLASKRELVHLVIDSEQTEIDAYPLLPSGSLVGQVSQRKALRNSLINRYPQAIITTPVKSSELDALLVQKLNLSEQSWHWLSYVELSAVTFCSVASSAETVANLSIDISADLLSDIYVNKAQSFLVVSNVLGYCKHTYCQSGDALFTRTLEHSQGVSIIDGLEETLSHLQTAEVIQTAVRVCLIGCADQELSRIAELEWVDGVVQWEDTTAFESLEKMVPDDNPIQYRPVIDIARHALKQTANRQHMSKRYVSMKLTKYIQFAKHRRSLLRLAAISFLAIGSIGYSVSKHWHEQHRHSDYTKSKAVLASTIDQAKQALIDESSHGIALSNALFDTKALKSSAGPDAALLLTIIATVFTEHRLLELQELSWVVIDQAAARAADLKAGAALRVAASRHVSTEQPSPSKLAVDVVGNIQSSASLRVQQRALDAVVAMLDSYQTISNLVVLEAPLTKVATDDRVGADALDLTTSFRIQFQIDRSTSDEA